MMSLVAGAFLAAAAAAVRGTWSPCGWSMYSTLTPLAERGRGHRSWAPTAGWFLAGAVIGGAMLGSVAALGAWTLARMDLGGPASTTLATAAFVLAFAFDEGLLRPTLPHHRRQVDEGWLDRYRRWVYAGGFGLQIGTGLATYVMTAGVYLVIVIGALTARPGLAFSVGVTFGATRGSALLLAARLDRPERLRSFHRRFARLEPPVRHAVAACWGMAALMTGAGAARTTIVIAAGAAMLVALAAVVSGAPRRVHAAQGQTEFWGTHARSTLRSRSSSPIASAKKGSNWVG